MLGSEPRSCIGIHVGMSWAWAPIVGTCKEREDSSYYGEYRSTGDTFGILDTILDKQRKIFFFPQAIYCRNLGGDVQKHQYVCSRKYSHEIYSRPCVT